MASNKKPRKKYVPNIRHMHPSRMIELKRQLHEMLQNILLPIHTSLPFGTATPKQISRMADVFSWAVNTIEVRRKHLDPKEIEDCNPVLKAGQDALTAIVGRACGMKVERFTASGDEIRALADAFAIVRQIIEDAIEEHPLRAFREYEDALRKIYEEGRGVELWPAKP